MSNLFQIIADKSSLYSVSNIDRVSANTSPLGPPTEILPLPTHSICPGAILFTALVVTPTAEFSKTKLLNISRLPKPFCKERTGPSVINAAICDNFSVSFALQVIIDWSKDFSIEGCIPASSRLTVH